MVCYFCRLLFMYWLLLFSDVYLSTDGSTVDKKFVCPLQVMAVVVLVRTKFTVHYLGVLGNH